MSRSPLLAALLLVAACSTEPSGGPLPIIGNGNYAYTAYGASGVKLLQGTIHLEYGVLPAAATPPRGLAGTYSIDWAPGADHSIVVGPQIGSGQLDGQTDDSGVKLSFLPNEVDSFLSLTGTVFGTSVDGTWSYSTIAGPAQHGRFTLVPIR